MDRKDTLNPGYYVSDDLRALGFAKVGENVMISRMCNIVGVQNISIGSNVRIDFATTIVAGAAGVEIGNYVHIGSYCYLSGKFGIKLLDFTGLSQRVSLYTASDDYSGPALTNPMVPEEFTNVTKKPIFLERHVILGANTTVLPGVCIAEGSACGAYTLVSKNLDSWGLYQGVPAKKLKGRAKVDPDNAIAKQLLSFE